MLYINLPFSNYSYLTFYFDFIVTNLMCMTDIISFTISELSDNFVTSMNQDDILFTIQYILESLLSIDPVFVFNLSYGNDNNVTDIV